MNWNNAPQYNDNRRLLEISVEEAKTRIREIINSNPIINGSIISTDGNLRQTLKKMTTVKNQITADAYQLYKDNILSSANRAWTDFQNAVTKLITDFLIYENYKFYLQDRIVINSYMIEKGGIWFLPSYFCLRDKYRGKFIEFFSNRVGDYHVKEFYCESLDNQRHPCLTIEVAPDNHFFSALVCSNSYYDRKNEPITLKKNLKDHHQYVALEWKVKASRKMLDIRDTEGLRFSIEDDELARIQGRMMMKN
jgi:hypothetical protein